MFFLPCLFTSTITALSSSFYFQCHTGLELVGLFLFLLPSQFDFIYQTNQIMSPTCPEPFNGFPGSFSDLRGLSRLIYSLFTFPSIILPVQAFAIRAKPFPLGTLKFCSCALEMLPLRCCGLHFGLCASHLSSEVLSAAMAAEPPLG